MNLNFVRATYWIGAIVDALAALQLMTPTSESVLGFPGLRAPGAAGQPAVIAAVLMLGFSAVLLWGHLRTRERRTLLAITFVVVLGLAAVNLILGASGAMTWSQLGPTLTIQTVLAVMFGLSFRIARKAALASRAV
jgi:peptidoglycan/LPS O-acetylase OafA/YrhL